MTQTSPFKRYGLDISIYKKEKINKKICTSKHSLYYILNYDKQYLTFDNEEAATYRSVVFSFPEKTPLCFSPPRSISLDAFKMNNPENLMAWDSESIVVNEVVEGIMVNLFYDKRISKWEIATKSSIGGQYWFYSIKTVSNKKTFYKMFMESLSSSEHQELNDLPFLAFFPKWANFSFVLQHPENPFIIPVKKPQLYLVAMYTNQESYVEYIPHCIYESMNIFKNLEGLIAFPKKYSIASYDEQDYPYEARAGLMLWNDDTGERAKWVNPVYESIRRMKRIEPFPQYIYFCMRRIHYTSKQENQLSHVIDPHEYMLHFPCWKKQFHRIDEEFRIFVQNVYDAYLEIYMYKNKHAVFLKKHSIHARKIHHSIYLPRMRQARRERTKPFYISKKEVTHYFDRMEPREVLFLMNEDRRNVDEHLWRT